MAKIKETRNTYSVYRIHRTDVIKKIGLGDKGEYFETYVYYNHIKKHGYKAAILGKAFMAACQFREVNKGYPRGFQSYRTYNEKEQKRRFGETQEDRDKLKHVSDIEL